MGAASGATTASSTPNLSAMSSSTSSLQEPSKSPNNASFDEAMFTTNMDDFLSVRGTQSRSTSFPSIHFGGDEDDESDEDEDEDEDDDDDEEEDSEDDADESTEEEASRSKRKSQQRTRQTSQVGLGLLGRKGAIFDGVNSPSGTETSGGSTLTWGSRMLYIQMEYVENQTLKEVRPASSLVDSPDVADFV